MNHYDYWKNKIKEVDFMINMLGSNQTPNNLKLLEKYQMMKKIGKEILEDLSPILEDEQYCSSVELGYQDKIEELINEINDVHYQIEKENENCYHEFTKQEKNLRKLSEIFDVIKDEESNKLIDEHMNFSNILSQHIEKVELYQIEDVEWVNRNKEAITEIDEKINKILNNFSNTSLKKKFKK